MPVALLMTCLAVATAWQEVTTEIFVAGKRVVLIGDAMSDVDAEALCGLGNDYYLEGRYEEAIELASAVAKHGRRTGQYDRALLLRAKALFLASTSGDGELWDPYVQTKRGMCVEDLRRIATTSPDGEVARGGELEAAVRKMLGHCLSNGGAPPGDWKSREGRETVYQRLEALGWRWGSDVGGRLEPASTRELNRGKLGLFRGPARGDFGRGRRREPDELRPFFQTSEFGPDVQTALALMRLASTHLEGLFAEYEETLRELLERKIRWEFHGETEPQGEESLAGMDELAMVREVVEGIRLGELLDRLNIHVADEAGEGGRLHVAEAEAKMGPRRLSGLWASGPREIHGVGFFDPIEDVVFAFDPRVGWPRDLAGLGRSDLFEPRSFAARILTWSTVAERHTNEATHSRMGRIRVETCHSVVVKLSGEATIRQLFIAARGEDPVERMRRDVDPLGK